MDMIFLQSYVSFAEYRLFSMSLLQKRPTISRSFIVRINLWTSLSLHIYIYRSLLQNIVSFLCLFCKRDLQSQDPSSYDCKKIIYVKIKKSKDQHIYRYAYVYMCISKINICIDMYMCIYVICKDKEVLVQS